MNLTFSTEVQLVIAAVAFYFYESSVLLFANEALASPVGRNRWQVKIGASGFKAAAGAVSRLAANSRTVSGFTAKQAEVATAGPPPRAHPAQRRTGRGAREGGDCKAKPANALVDAGQSEKPAAG